MQTFKIERVDRQPFFIAPIPPSSSFSLENQVLVTGAEIPWGGTLLVSGVSGRFEGVVSLNEAILHLLASPDSVLVASHWNHRGGRPTEFQGLPLVLANFVISPLGNDKPVSV